MFKTILLLACAAMCMASHSGHSASAVKRTGGASCNPQRPLVALQEYQLKNLSKNFLVTLTTFNETKIRAISSTDIVGCFEVAQNGNLGCFVGIDSFLGYTSILNFTATEFAINYPNFTIQWQVASVVQREVMMYITWPIFNIQTNTLCQIKMTLLFGFDCDNLVNYYGVQVDGGDAAKCNLPVISDCNATRICLGGQNRNPDGSYGVYQNGIMTACTGVNQVYTTASDCINFVGSLTCFGPQFSYGNTTQCRDWHRVLSNIHPEIHCQHVSKDGGFKCCDGPLCAH